VNDPEWVLDSSAALALVLSDEDGAEVQEIMAQAIASQEPVLVPALFWYETGNALLTAWRRQRISDEERLSIEQDLAALPILVDPSPDAQVRGAIRNMAESYRLTYYDASYLELALRKRRRLKSYDQDLLRLRPQFEFIA